MATQALACSSKNDEVSGTDPENLHGKWKVTSMEGKLFIKVSGIPETEVPLMTFWSGKLFYFEDQNRLSVWDAQKELFDFGPYTLSGNRLTVANGPGTLQLHLSDNTSLTLTNSQDDYYKMLAFYNGQSVAEVKKMYRTEGNIVFHLKKQ